jgi:ABC-type dipeptide/oligopeptide/nickel transport system permease component
MREDIKMIELIERTLQGFCVVCVIFIILFIIFCIVNSIEDARMQKNKDIEKRVTQNVYDRWNLDKQFFNLELK